MNTKAIDAVLTAGVARREDGSVKLPGAIFIAANVKSKTFRG
jgi:hypothetical protein